MDTTSDRKKETVSALFERAVTQYGPNPLILFDDSSSLSYSDAGALVHDIAGRLQAIGVGKGERVVSVSAASAEAALVFWASMLSGAVFVPVDSGIQPDKLSGILKSIGPKIVFTSPEWAAKSALKGIRSVSYSTNSQPNGSQPFHEFLEGSGEYCPQPVSPSDDAVVLFTSGTSGEPNGIVLSHGALSGSGHLLAGAYQWGPSDRVLSTGDFHTMSGLRNPLVAALSAGASFIIAPQAIRASAPSCSALMEKLGATVLCTVPAALAQFTRFQEKISKGFTGRLRFVMCTGTNLPPAIAEEFESRYDRAVLNYYGLTETAGLCIGVTPGMKTGTGVIGVPLGCSAVITGPGNKKVKDGETGELLIRTENIMSGYYNNQKATEEAFVDGWFRTKDFCRRRPDGSIELLGRVDDAFKDMRGELVHPSEIEKVLEGFPLVLEAAVCGFDAEDGRPAAAAFVVARENGTDEKSMVNELLRLTLSVLGPYRTPAVFRFVDSLPRGTNGKILRRKLRETLLCAAS